MNSRRLWVSFGKPRPAQAVGVPGAVFRPLLGTSPKLAPLDIQGIVLKAKLHLDDLLRASLHCGNIKK